MTPSLAIVKRPKVWEIEGYARSILNRADTGDFFVIFSVYLDESGIGIESGNLILAAVVGREYQWTRWEEDIWRLQRKGGFERLHATELYNEMKKHGDPKYIDYVIQDIGELLRKLEFSVVAVLNKEQYKSDYISEGFPEGCRPETQYALCLKYLLLQINTRLWDLYGERIAQIGFIAEGFSQYDLEAQKVYFDFRELLAPPEIKPLLSDTLGMKDNRKKESRPLFAPDFLGRFIMRLARDGELEMVKPESASIEALEQKIFIQNLDAKAMQWSRELTIQAHNESLVTGKGAPKGQS